MNRVILCINLASSGKCWVFMHEMILTDFIRVSVYLATVVPPADVHSNVNLWRAICALSNRCGDHAIYAHTESITREKIADSRETHNNYNNDLAWWFVSETAEKNIWFILLFHRDFLSIQLLKEFLRMQFLSGAIQINNKIRELFTNRTIANKPFTLYVQDTK